MLKAGELEAALRDLAERLAADKGKSEGVSRIERAAAQPSAGLRGDGLAALAETAVGCAGGMDSILARPRKDPLLQPLSVLLEAAFAELPGDALLALNSGLLLLHQGQKKAAKTRLARASRIARSRKGLADILRQAQLALLRDLSG